MDWQTMCKIEPKLIDLQSDADGNNKDNPRFWQRYESIKAQAKRMVGYYAINEKLQTRECYDIAHDNIFRSMK